MPIPHQVIYIQHGGSPLPPGPGIVTELETYPIEQAVNYVATNAADWQGEAQVFDLQDPTQSTDNAYLWGEFYLLSPPQAGFEYRIALYRKSNDQHASLVGISDLLSTIGANPGYKWVKIKPPTGQNNIHLEAGDHYQIALLTNQYNVGEMVFKCKYYDDPMPYKSNHITSPPAATSQTSEGNLMNIEFGNWRSNFYLWFAVALEGATNSENLP